MWREWIDLPYYRGRPMSVTLYADHDHWRFALATEGGEFLDGRLPEAGRTADEAQAAMLERLAIHWEVEPRVGWEPYKPGWWSAELQAMEGTPALIPWT